MLNSTNSSGNLSSIKMMGYIYLFCYLLYMISFAGWFFLAIALVFFILASYSIAKRAKVHLVSKLVLACVLFFIGALLIILGVTSTWFVILGFTAILGSLYLYYKFYHTIARVTNERFFLYTFFAKAVFTISIIILPVPVIGWLINSFFLLIAVIIEIIAWIRFSEIRTIN